MAPVLLLLRRFKGATIYSEQPVCGAGRCPEHPARRVPPHVSCVHLACLHIPWAGANMFVKTTRRLLS